MEVAEPGEAFALEVGEGSLFELGFGCAGWVEQGTAFFVHFFGDDAETVDRFDPGWPVGVSEI